MQAYSVKSLRLCRIYAQFAACSIEYLRNYKHNVFFFLVFFFFFINQKKEKQNSRIIVV